MAEGTERRSPYRQFSIGQELPFTLNTLAQDGSIYSKEQQITVEAIRGGGFFGRVLIPEEGNFVIKTSVPDPWHDLWRRANWGFREFPSQVSETQAKLDYLASNLIADTIPVLTDGRFIVPHTFGYTQLANGYAQVVERMHGRPPRYDTQNDEFNDFQESMEELTALGLEMGLEHSAQVYKRGDLKNHFGMANLWEEPETKQKIWLDTLPAIPHKGFIWPFYYFRFHKDVRNWFYPESDNQEITFNKIHTDRFLETINRQRHKFTDEAFQQICSNIDLYRQFLQEVPAAESTNLRAVISAGVETARAVLPKPLTLIKETINAPFKLVRDPNSAALAGLENAFGAGIISEEEFDRVKNTLSSDIAATRTMAILYEGYGWILSKPVEILSYANILGLDFSRVKDSGILELVSYASNQLGDPHRVVSLIAAYCGIKAFGGLVRNVETRLVGRHYKVDTKRARTLALLPFIGDYTALVAQATASIGRSGSEIWHYTIRNIVAKTSGLPIFPDGGWGSEREGRWWKQWGKPLESLGRKTN